MLFKKGHIPWNKGMKISEMGYFISKETKKKMSEARKGTSPWNKGKEGIYSKGTLEKMSEAKMGHFVSEETKRKMSEARKGEKNSFYGRHHTKEVKEKSRKINIGNSHALGCHWTEAAKKKKSEAEKGEGGPFYGRHHTKEAKEKQRMTKVREKNPRWRGGKSFEPYTPAFNKQLKELIRYRDGYKCQLCGCPEIENKTRLTIHHINYEKADCKPYNLISLCKRCNNKVNTNREKWTIHFKKKIKMIMNSSCLQLSLPIHKINTQSKETVKWL